MTQKSQMIDHVTGGMCCWSAVVSGERSGYRPTASGQCTPIGDVLNFWDTPLRADQGDLGFGFRGGKSNAEGARIVAPQTPKIYGVRYREGCLPPICVPLSNFPSHWGGICPSPEIFFMFGSPNAYFGAFFGPFEYLFLDYNTSKSRPPVRLPSLTFQADCGSIKGAGVPAEEGTEHYLPWRWIRNKFNHCQRRNTESRRQQLSQLFFRWSWIWGERDAWSLGPLWIRQWVRLGSVWHGSISPGLSHNVLTRHASTAVTSCAISGDDPTARHAATPSAAETSSDDGRR